MIDWFIIGLSINGLIATFQQYILVYTSILLYRNFYYNCCNISSNIRATY